MTTNQEDKLIEDMHCNEIEMVDNDTDKLPEHMHCKEVDLAACNVASKDTKAAEVVPLMLEVAKVRVEEDDGESTLSR